LDYLRHQQAESTRPLNEAKFILVGQGGVGKTSLVKQLLGHDFDEAEPQTDGINIETWSLEVERSQQGIVPITLNIWDFGGQEIMHATHQFFLTQRSLYLLVLDARQGEDEGRVEYWLSLIHSFAPAAPSLSSSTNPTNTIWTSTGAACNKNTQAFRPSSAPPTAMALA
jgi:internalin A